MNHACDAMRSDRHVTKDIESNLRAIPSISSDRFIHHRRCCRDERLGLVVSRHTAHSLLCLSFPIGPFELLWLKRVSLERLLGAAFLILRIRTEKSSNLDSSSVNMPSLKQNQVVLLGAAATIVTATVLYYLLSGRKKENKGGGGDSTSRDIKTPSNKTSSGLETDKTPLVKNGDNKDTNNNNKALHSQIEELDKRGKALFKGKQVCIHPNLLGDFLI